PHGQRRPRRHRRRHPAGARRRLRRHHRRHPGPQPPGDRRLGRLKRGASPRRGRTTMRQRFIARAARAAIVLALAVVVALPAVGSTSASFTASAGAAGGDVTTIELLPLAEASAVVADDGSASISWSAPTVRPETFTGYRVERTVDGETTVLSPAVTTETTSPDDLHPERRVGKECRSRWSAYH